MAYVHCRQVASSERVGLPFQLQVPLEKGHVKFTCAICTESLDHLQQKDRRLSSGLFGKLFFPKKGIF
jgi:hypothetical protein